MADRNLDIRAISTIDNRDTGSVRLVVGNAEMTRAAFAEAGVACSTCICLAFEMPNTPGGFAAIARKLALGGVNIDYIYASAVPGPGPALGIFGVSDVERALSLDWES